MPELFACCSEKYEIPVSELVDWRFLWSLNCLFEEVMIVLCSMDVMARKIVIGEHR